MYTEDKGKFILGLIVVSLFALIQNTSIIVIYFAILFVQEIFFMSHFQNDRMIQQILMSIPLMGITVVSNTIDREMVQNMINVSVIIIGYNTEKYVKKCIESVILQSLTNIEIICVDDGSSDNTFSIMKEMSIKDERIKVYTQENSGPYAARKKGLDMAAGKYVVFIDSDDWIESEELMDAYVILEKYKLDIVFYEAIVKIRLKIFYMKCFEKKLVAIK